MKTVPAITLRVYKFDELDPAARCKAITDYLTFRIETYDDAMERETFIGKAITEAEGMRTPWFIHEIALEKGRDEIICDLSQEWYFENGDPVPHDSTAIKHVPEREAR